MKLETNRGYVEIVQTPSKKVEILETLDANVERIKKSDREETVVKTTEGTYMKIKEDGYKSESGSLDRNQVSRYLEDFEKEVRKLEERYRVSDQSG